MGEPRDHKLDGCSGDVQGRVDSICAKALFDGNRISHVNNGAD
jgi:hypothetical protein